LPTDPNPVDALSPSFAFKFEPTSLAIGTSRTLAIVWLINVDITYMNGASVDQTVPDPNVN